MALLLLPRRLWSLGAAVLLAGCAFSPPPPPTATAPPTPAPPRPTVAPSPTPEPAARETIEFQSLSFPGTLWSPFLPPRTEGAPATISGILTLPPERDPLPAAIIMHGCSGVGPSELGWAERLNGLGVATFVVQSFGGRGIPEVCTGRHPINIASVIVDAYQALDLLAAHPRIDPARIAILGFSFGGRTALWTSQARLQERYGQGRATFAAHLAFYPTGCYIQLVGEEQVTGGPIRVFHGAADDWTPIEQCKAYIGRLRDAGVDAALLEYADAHHGFDNGYSGFFTAPDALSPRSCMFVEREGMIIDAATGEEATLDSACVARGVSVGYNAEAHRQAGEDVDAFLTALFRLRERG